MKTRDLILAGLTMLAVGALLVGCHETSRSPDVNVSYAVKNGVVTLTGEVSSDHMRSGAEAVASGVPNVLQVVNDLQVTGNRKASSAQ